MKKQQAQQLFTEGQLSPKEIAAKLGITEQTIARWAVQGNWDTMRKSMLTTRTEILAGLYDTLDAMKNEAKKIATDGNPDTKPDANGIYKMALAIRKLETESSLGEIVEVAKEFTTFVKNQDLDMAKEIVYWFDLFIESKLKSKSF